MPRARTVGGSEAADGQPIEAGHIGSKFTLLPFGGADRQGYDLDGSLVQVVDMPVQTFAASHVAPQTGIEVAHG